MTRRRWWTAALALLVIAVATAVVTTSRARGRTARAAAVQRYLVAIEPIARDGGRVVQEGLKPALADLEVGRDVGPAELAGRVEGFVFELREAARRWAAVEPPDVLDDPHGGFLDALSRYVEVGSFVERAARATGSARATLVSEAISRGDEADDVFDAASFDVQKTLKRLGLAEVSWLPRPEPLASYKMSSDVYWSIFTQDGVLTT